MSALDFDVSIHGDQLQKDIDGVNRRIKGMTQGITNEGKNIDSVFKNIGIGIGAYFSTQAISSFLQEMVKVRGEFQKFEAVLTNTLGGDKIKSSGLLKGLAEFAANTPYQLTDITENFIKLANQGIILTREELTKLGDVAAVTGKPFGQLSEAIMDVNNTERWKEFGMRVTTEGEKVTMSFRGQRIEFERTIEGAKNAIAKIGSMDGVAGTMSVISKTLLGQISNLQDAWDAMLNEMGKSGEGVFSGVIAGASALVTNYKLFVEILGSMIAVYGAAKVASIMYNTIMVESTVLKGYTTVATKSLITAEQLHELWIKRVAAAQLWLNKTMFANPYVLVAASVVAVVGAMVMLNKQFERSIDAQRRFNDQTKNLDENYQTRIDKAKELMGTLKDETKAESERLKALKELQEIYPSIFANMDLQSGKLTDLAEKTK